MVTIRDSDTPGEAQPGVLADAHAPGLSGRAPPRERERRALLAIPAFKGLSGDSLEQLLPTVELQRIARNTVLFEEGEEPHHLHILVKGQIGLFGTQAGSSETIIEVIDRNEPFITAAVLTGAPYLMGARTLEDSTLLLVGAEGLRQRIKVDAALATAMLESLAWRFRSMVRQVKDLKLRSSAQRVGCYLLSLSAAQRGAKTVALPYAKRILAPRLGMTPESLSRSFVQLRRYGVRVRGDRVQLDDLDGLRRYSQPDKVVD